MNEPRIEEQPYEDRHNTPVVPRNAVADGEHIGNDHQEPVWTEDNGGFQLPSRRPGHNLFSPAPVIPSFGTGLSWQASAQSPRVDDLASIDWDSMKGMPNVELRTLFAHLMEASSAVRAEMRARAMQVDL